MDTVGAMLTDSATVNFTYNDGGDSVVADVIISGVVDGINAAFGNPFPQYVLQCELAPGTLTDTDDLPEGTTNLYYTDARVEARIALHEAEADPHPVYVTDAELSSALVSYVQHCELPSTSGILPRGYLWGLTMSNAADTNNDITVDAGEATSEDHGELMTLDAPITKQLDASWAVGTNAGGLNTGAEAANTWYEVHLIKRTDTGVVDVMFTTTANRATLPANYDKQRRIGWVRNDAGSALLQFTQVDDHFTLTTQVNDVSATATATAAAVTLTAPPNSIARFRAGTTSTTSVNTTNATVFSEIVEGNVTPTETTGIVSIGACDIAGADGGHFELRVSASSQIEHDSDGASYTFDISTYGWIDHRRRMSAT
jgi:hypothetical protein